VQFLKAVGLFIAVFECREWRQRAGAFSYFEAVSSVGVVRAFRGGFPGAFRVKGERVFGVQVLFVPLVFGVGFALDWLQLFQAVLERRGNRSAFLGRVFQKRDGVLRRFWKMDAVRKSSCGGAPQFFGEAFSRVSAQMLFVGLPVFRAAPWKNLLVSGGSSRGAFFSRA